MTQAEAASNVRLAIRVAPGEAIPGKSFIRIRGLPPTARLTEGYAIAPGYWTVPLTALSNLTIVLPAGLQGQSDVAISLVSVDGTVLAEARTVLVVAASSAGSSARAGTPQALAPADRERALNLHAKGQEQLDRGNIYAARKFFERAAEIGLGQSAMALADTYDPLELAKRGVVGIEPDVEAARGWYERARELGAIEATDRLRRLGAR